LSYEELLQEAYDLGLDVREKPLIGYSGLIHRNRIAIRRSLANSREKASVLAEEIGHALTTVGDILDQTDVQNCKQEMRARRVGHELMISQADLLSAAKAGCRSAFEVAMFLNVTEQFLSEAIEDFKRKYGCAFVSDDFVVQYEPYLMIYSISEEDAQ